MVLCVFQPCCIIIGPYKLLVINTIQIYHSTKKPVTTMLTYPWKCTVLHCNHLGNTWKPLVLMTRHFDYCPNASEGDNQSVRSSASVVSRCSPGGYNVKLYISRGWLAWWLLAFLHSDMQREVISTCNLEVLTLFHRTALFWKWEGPNMHTSPFYLSIPHS